LKKIGIYGGTFDPIHHAHLILAREALESLGLAEVIFVLAARSPHKADQSATCASVRWEMLVAALAGEPGFRASRLELDRPPPSYSVDTVEAIRVAEPEAALFLLLGEDNLPRLHEWHRFEELKTFVQFVVLDRNGDQKEGSYVTIHRRIAISATNIRNRVASGQSIRYLVPEPVELIIRRENLYLGPHDRP
jgi:nicotinate-nucleotide adenylyltransferase